MDGKKMFYNICVYIVLISLTIWHCIGIYSLFFSLFLCFFFDYKTNFFIGLCILFIVAASKCIYMYCGHDNKKISQYVSLPSPRVKGLRYLKKNKRYVFAVSPHGSSTLQSILLFSKLQRIQKDIILLVHNILFYMPLWNIVLPQLSFDTANKINFKKKLTSHSVYFMPGGVSDMFNVETNQSGKETINIPYGWIKYALQEGSLIVPVYNFDETSVLKTAHAPFLKMRKKIQSHIRLALIFPDLGNIMSLSKLKQCTSAIGKPLQLPKIENPTKQDIYQWHRIYCKRLLHLIDKHKKAAGYPDLTVTIRELEVNQRFFRRRRRRECK